MADRGRIADPGRRDVSLRQTQKDRRGSQQPPVAVEGEDLGVDLVDEDEGQALIVAGLKNP